MAYSDPRIPTVNIEEQDPVTGLISEGTVVGTPPGGAGYAGIFSLECELTDTEGSGTFTNTGTVAVPAWTLFGTIASLANTKIFVGSAANVATAQTVSGDATLAANGALTIANDAITTVKILNANVTAAKLATDAVETVKIKDLNVTVGKLAADAVETAKIKDANVTLGKLAAGITPSHVVKYAGTATGGTTATRAYTVTGALATDIVTATTKAFTNSCYITKAVLTNDTLTVDFNTDPGAATEVYYTIVRAAA